MADWDSSSWAETRFSAEVLAASPASLVRLSHLTNIEMAAITAVMATMTAVIWMAERLKKDVNDFCVALAVFVALAN